MSCDHHVTHPLHVCHVLCVYLQVWVHEGISSVEDDYVLCLRTEDTSRIPNEGYFGVSAATGGLSDDHDILSFIVHSLTPMEEKTQEVRGVTLATSLSSIPSLPPSLPAPQVPEPGGG